MSQKAQRDQDDHEEADPVAAGERPRRRGGGRQVVVERGDDVGHEALNDD